MKTVDTSLDEFVTNHFKPVYYVTSGYPEFWQLVYQETIKHFSDKWGQVGPLYFFLIQTNSWHHIANSKQKEIKELKSIQKPNVELKQEYNHIINQNQEINWDSGEHGLSWSINPKAMLIAMTMSPYEDSIQFVLGPIHEYMHAYQTAYGFQPKAVDSNQMGQALWRGPSWWMEGSATLVSSLYCYQHPELFDKIDDWWDWESLSRDLNHRLKNYKQSGRRITDGVTHNDWQMLEEENLVSQVIYDGGNTACVLLLKKCGSLQNFIAVFDLIPELGWETAFQKHFNLTVEEFYTELEEFVIEAKVSLEKPSGKEDWCGFLK